MHVEMNFTAASCLAAMHTKFCRLRNFKLLSTVIKEYWSNDGNQSMQTKLPYNAYIKKACNKWFWVKSLKVKHRVPNQESQFKQCVNQPQAILTVKKFVISACSVAFKFLTHIKFIKREYQNNFFHFLQVFINTLTEESSPW